MAKILTFSSHQVPPKETLGDKIKGLWEKFSSLDRFTKLSVITMVLINVAGFASVGVYFELRSHAAQNITTIPIDDFEADSTSVNGWTVSTWPTGVIGNISLLAPGHNNSAQAATISFTFQPTSAGVQQVIMDKSFSTTQPTAAELGFWVKSPAGVRVLVFVFDSTGQRFEYDTERPLEATDPNAWYQKVIKLDEPTQHVNGANDDVVHYPISRISIAGAALRGKQDSSNNALLNGQVAIDDIQWMDINTTIVSRDVDPTDTNIIAQSPVPGTLLDNLSTGAHGNLTTTTLSELQQTGVKLSRVDLSWQNVETSPGLYNWSYYDSYFSQLQSIGIKKVLFILAYGNTLYYSPIQTSSGQDYGNATAVTQYVNFAKAAATHFNTKFPGQFMFEVWNEPDGSSYWYPGANAGQYATLESATVTAIQSVNPSILITTAGIADNYNYLHSYISSLQSFSQNPGEHANATSFHPYQQDIPETISDNLSYIRYYMSQVSPSIQTWITEWGYPSDASWWNIANTTDYLRTQGSDLLALQAKMVARQLWTVAALGIPHMDHYVLRDSPTAGDYYGLRDSSDNSKPAWNAFTTVTKFAQQFPQFVGIEPMQLTNLHTVVLKNSSQYLLVIWKDGLGSPVTANISSTFTIQSVTDYMGNAVNITGRSVLINDTPVYVIVNNPNAPSPAPSPTPPTIAPTATIVVTPTSGVADTTPPIVSITSPLNGVKVARRSMLTISATATDNIGVTQVQFSVNNTVVCTVTLSPYTCNFSVSGKPGAIYALTARAFDAKGNSAQSNAVTITAQ